MAFLKCKSTFLASIFLVAVMAACSTSNNAIDQKRYSSDMNDMIVATNKAIADAGLNIKGSMYLSNGSFKITAVELVRQYGTEEPVQTMSIDIILDRIDESTVLVEIPTPNRKTYVMAGASQTAENEFREKIFNSLEKTIGSIKSK